MNTDWLRAVQRGSIEEVARLRAEGVDIDARDGHGQTALMLAAMSGRADLVRWLVQHGAGLDFTAKYGLSAAMLAVVRGHVEIVQVLAGAGADLNLRGSGALGFAGKTALDLARARNDPEMVAALSTQAPTRRTDNPHFETAASWDAARAMLTFTPRKPDRTAGHALQALRIHVRDHKMRDLPAADRTLEAHYGAFVFSQSRHSPEETRRLALGVSYGRDPRGARILGRDARLYELGPEPEPGDIDGRSPAVVAWHDAEMFYLIASDTMGSDELFAIAISV